MKKLQLKKQVSLLQILVEKCKRHPAYRAMSGFGTMVSCAAGELCAKCIVGDPPSSHATNFSVKRREDMQFMQKLQASNIGIL